MPRFYLAFASNMNRTQMGARCPAAEPVAAVRVRDWRLTFRGTWSKTWGPGGVATLEPAAGESAPGALYRMSAEDELAMDVYEGVNELDPERGAYRKLADFAANIEPTGDWCLPPDTVVFTYLCNHATPTPPAATYLATIRQGYRDWGFDALPEVEPYPTQHAGQAT